MACCASLQFIITLTLILTAPQAEGSRGEDMSQLAKVLETSSEPSSQVLTTLPDDVRHVERLVLASSKSGYMGKIVILPALKKDNDGFSVEISRSAVIRFFYTACCEHLSGQQVAYSDEFAPGLYNKNGRRPGSLAAHHNSEGAVVFQGAAEQAVYKEKKSDLQQKLPLPPDAVGQFAQATKKYLVEIDGWQLGQLPSTGDVDEAGHHHSLEGLLEAVIRGDLAIKVEMNGEQRFGFANPNFNGRVADALVRACPKKGLKGRLAAVPVLMATPQQNAKWEDARWDEIMGKWNAIRAKRREERMEEIAREDRFADEAAYTEAKLDRMEGAQRAIYAAKVDKALTHQEALMRDFVEADARKQERHAEALEGYQEHLERWDADVQASNAAKVDKATKHQEALIRDFVGADARKGERHAEVIEGYQERLERWNADVQTSNERGELEAQLKAQRGLEMLERSGLGSLVALSTVEEQHARHQVLPDGRGTLVFKYDCVGPSLVVQELVFYLWPDRVDDPS